MIDFRRGDYRDVMADVECDALIVDPPYGARTHDGHSAGVNGHQGKGKDTRNRLDLSYASWSPDDVSEFVEFWAPRTRGWICAMTSHDLVPAYERALQAAGRYVFAPLPCVIRGMTVRLSGDGPSSWSVSLVVSRPRVKPFSNWGTLPGAYVTTRGERTGAEQYTGGKPLKLMSAIVRDYTRKGDLVCDPCAGWATTGVAALSLGRRFVGAEVKPDTFARASERLKAPSQADLFAHVGAS